MVQAHNMRRVTNSLRIVHDDRACSLFLHSTVMDRRLELPCNPKTSPANGRLAFRSVHGLKLKVYRATSGTSGVRLGRSTTVVRLALLTMHKLRHLYPQAALRSQCDLSATLPHGIVRCQTFTAPWGLDDAEARARGMRSIGANPRDVTQRSLACETCRDANSGPAAT